MMKKFNSRFVVPATVLLLVTACAGKERSVKGVIVEASMNTLSVVPASGDTLSFGTADAVRTAKEGILLGDTATVFYTGALEPVTPATRIDVVPGKRTPALEGEWIQPVNGLPGQVQGFRLEPNGTAASVNMATLLYESWTRQGDSLVMTGKSLGNGQTIPFTDTCRIESLTPDSLILNVAGARWSYSRKP